jgi:hypothetical protein
MALDIPGRPATFSRSTADAPSAATPASTPAPIKAWAVLGGLCLALIVVVWARWLTGPYTNTVPTGATPLPGWMKTVLIAGEIAIVPGALWCFWHFLIAPWRRERRLCTDGLLCVAYLLVWFQDPLSNYFHPWITWNSYLVNLGGWTHEIPGWLGGGTPGATVPEPIIFAPALYVCVWMGLTLGGCKLMRTAKTRWPQLGPYRLFALTFAAMFAADFVIEGLIFMPLGFWTYAGGPAPILFPHSYHALPLHEPLFIGLMMASYASLRYYRNDRGMTIAERGVERVHGGRRQGWLRLLAMIGAVQLVFLVTFTIPVSFVGAHPRTWPTAVQKRSYLTDGLCGQNTGIACRRSAGR